MFKSLKNILLVVLTLSIFSCQNHKKNDISEIPIAKEEPIKKRNEVFISVNDTISSFFTNLFLDDMQDKPDMLYLGQKQGKTSVTIPTKDKIRLIGGDPFISFFYEIELQKGDSLLINTVILDVNPSKQIEYPTFIVLNSDKTWNETNFDYLLYKYNINNKAIEIGDRGGFSNKYNAESVYKNSIHLLDSLKAAHGISNDFYEASKINQKLKFATSKIREAKNKNLELDIADLDIKLNDEELYNNKHYISFLRAMVRYNYFKTQKRVLNSVQFDYLTNNETFLNNNTKQVLLDAYLKSIFAVENSKFPKYLSIFNGINSNEDLKNKWQSVVHKQNANKEKQNASNKNIGILSNLVNDNQLTFNELLAKHKGNLVLVDFWASWCAPCRKEMPFLKDLKTKFNDTEIKIIEISIDTDYSSWVRASQLENISNQKDSYIISNWKASNLYKDYNIKTIPRYLLFGKDGNIINDNAPRPSEDKLEALIKANI